MNKTTPRMPLAGGAYERTGAGLKKVGGTTAPAPGKTAARKAAAKADKPGKGDAPKAGKGA